MDKNTTLFLFTDRPLTHRREGLLEEINSFFDDEVSKFEDFEEKSGLWYGGSEVSNCDCYITVLETNKHILDLIKHLESIEWKERGIGFAQLCYRTNPTNYMTLVDIYIPTWKEYVV